jgi:hypothetical protein
MLLSISQLAELTAFDRRTIAKSLKDLRSINGERGALLYESTEALPALFHTDSLEAARAKQANSQASLNAVREQDLRRQRIPLQVVTDTMDEVFQALGSTLKAAKGKTLSTEMINELFDKFRAAPAALKW